MTSDLIVMKFDKDYDGFFIRVNYKGKEFFYRNASVNYNPLGGIVKMRKCDFDIIMDGIADLKN